MNFEQDQIIAQQKEYYSTYKKIADNPRYKKARTYILNNSLGDEKILDVGCTNGDFLLPLLQKGYNGYGLEIMDEAIEESLQKGIRVTKGTFLNPFPFEDNYFDFIFAGEVIEHTIDDVAFAKELFRVLKPGGTVILTTPNLVSFGNRLRMMFGKMPRFAYNEFHYRIYNFQLLKTKIEKAGLSIFHVDSSYILISQFYNKFLGFFGEMFGSLFPKFGEHFIVFAKKPSAANYIFNEKGFANAGSEEVSRSYHKYIHHIQDVLKGKTGSKFLDIGCGVGNVVDKISQMKNVEASGLDIGVDSIEIAKKNKKGQFFVYDGTKFPFQDEIFDVVGSYNVLEHVDTPELFLDEQFRVLKKGGSLVVACPNFLSVTNNYHHHTRGIKQKIKNVFDFSKKLFQKEYVFEKMNMVKNVPFRADDDACNVTNPLDIMRWAKQKGMHVELWSSQSVYKSGIVNTLDTGFFRYFLGSSFIIFKK